MKSILSVFLIFVCSAALASQSIVVLPFSDESEKQDAYWLSEGFAETLSEELLLRDAYVVQRPQRRGAYDELRLPYTGNLSRATMLKIGEKLSADYVVFGSYDLKNNDLAAEVKVIRLASAELSEPIQAEGTLDHLYELQTALLDGLIRYFDRERLFPIQEKETESKPIPLYAYEFYIKGLLEPADSEKIPFFQRAIRASPGYQQAIYRLGLTLFRLQRYKESNDSLKGVLFQDVLRAKADFLIGLNAYFSNDFDAAYAKWLEVSKSHPTAEVYNNLGIALMKKSDFQSSGWYLSKAVEMDSKNGDYRFNLAASYIQRSFDQNAVQQYRELIRFDPSDHQTFYLLAKLLEREQDPSSKRVMQFFQETLPADQKGKFPEQYNTVLQLLRPVLQFLSEGEKEFLNSSIDQRLEERSDFVRTYQSSARKHLEEGDPDRAIMEIRKGVSQDPFDWTLHYLWGVALLQKKDKNTAVTELEFSIWCRDNVDSHLLLAEIYRQGDQYADAKLQVQRTLALDPNNKKALEIWNKVWDKK